MASQASRYAAREMQDRWQIEVELRKARQEADELRAKLARRDQELQARTTQAQSLDSFNEEWSAFKIGMRQAAQHNQRQAVIQSALEAAAMVGKMRSRLEQEATPSLYGQLATRLAAVPDDYQEPTSFLERVNARTKQFWD